MVHPQSSTYQRGIGMVEVLVTMVILALGLLGVTSLQFAAAKHNSDALARAQAVLVLEQFTERLRSAAIVGSTGDAVVLPEAYFDQDLYQFSNLSCSTGESAYDCYCAAFPGSLTNCHSAICNVNQTASFDIYQAFCQVVQHNPVAELSIQCIDNDASDSVSCSGGSRHILMVRWPSQTWQNQGHFLSPMCNPNVGDEYACVTQEVFF